MAGITSNYDSEGNVKDFLEIRKSVLKVLVSIGMDPSLPKLHLAGPPEVLPVLLDGRIVGSIASKIVGEAVANLRRLKVLAASVVSFSALCPKNISFSALNNDFISLTYNRYLKILRLVIFL